MRVIVNAPTEERAKASAILAVAEFYEAPPEEFTAKVVNASPEWEDEGSMGEPLQVVTSWEVEVDVTRHD